MKSEFADAVEAVANISVGPDSTGAGEINVFETNIRYLDGLLSAYDISNDRRLLCKVREVGDMLLVAVHTPNLMPIIRWDLHAAARGGRQVAHSNVLVAEIGSLCMEFTRLSLVTGDARYYDAVQRVMDFFRPVVPDESNILVSALVDMPSDGSPGAQLKPEGQHLACFVGGMLALGGRLVGSAEHLEKAHKLVDDCVWVYRALPLGIMPETYFMVPCANDAHYPWDEDEWKKAVTQRAGSDDSRNTDTIITDKHLPRGFTNIPDT